MLTINKICDKSDSFNRGIPLTVTGSDTPEELVDNFAFVFPLLVKNCTKHDVIGLGSI